MVFDVIIPVYRPDEKLERILRSLIRQVAQPRQILLLVTQDEKDADGVRRLRDEMEAIDPRIRTHAVPKAEYDHAGTRNLGVSLTPPGAEAFLMMTQDAVPADDHLTERLRDSLADETCAIAYARQLTDTDASVAEKCARRFNYPAEGVRKTIEDLDTRGIKTFFCSNVCAMYRRDVYDSTGGFEAPAIFNEDMVYAARVLRAGYSVHYRAEAQVVHAHAYPLRMQFRRSFDNGASQAIRKEVFAGVKPAKEGGRFVKDTCATLRRVRQGSRIPYFLLQSAFRYAGFACGKHYRMFPRGIRKAFSMNRAYWSRGEEA